MSSGWQDVADHRYEADWPWPVTRDRAARDDDDGDGEGLEVTERVSTSGFSRPRDLCGCSGLHRRHLNTRVAALRSDKTLFTKSRRWVLTGGAWLVGTETKGAEPSGWKHQQRGGVCPPTSAGPG